jgi:hypothetical protein
MIKFLVLELIKKSLEPYRVNLMKKQLQQSMTSIGVILLTLGTWSKAPTQAATIKADFSAEINYVNANVPGIGIGTLVSGTILYETVLDELDQIPLDFTLSFGNNDFTFDDLEEIRVSDFQGTSGFDIQAILKPREGLGDFSEGIFFEIFQEFGDSNLFLNSISSESSVRGYQTLNLSRQEVTPVPEPLTFGGTAVAGTLGLWLRRKRKASHYSTTP